MSPAGGLFGGPADGAELRIGDTDREAAVSALGEHYAAGRLTKSEYDERADRALTARTSSALWPLFADLPGPASETGPPPPGGPWPLRGSSGRRLGRLAKPLLVVLLVMVVLTHLPVIALVLVGWLVWAALLRHRGHVVWHQGPRGPHGHARAGWDRSRW